MPNRIEIDPKILVQAKKGHRPSFEHVVLVCERPVYSFIYRMTGKQEDAEDLTQETFIKLYRNFKSFDETKKFSSWLFTIATRTVYDWLRKHRNKKELFIIDDVESGYETIDKKDAYKRIRAGIDINKAIIRLRPEYRTVLQLFYWQGLEYQEIAVSMKVPVNTIKTYISRAKVALRKEMDK